MTQFKHSGEIVIRAGEFKGYNAFVLDNSPEMYAILCTSGVLVFVCSGHVKVNGNKVVCVRGPHKGVKGVFTVPKKVVPKKLHVRLDTGIFLTIDESSVFYKDLLLTDNSYFQVNHIESNSTFRGVHYITGDAIVSKNQVAQSYLLLINVLDDNLNESPESVPEFVGEPDVTPHELSECGDAEDPEAECIEGQYPEIGDTGSEALECAKPETEGVLTVTHNDIMRTLYSADISSEDKYIHQDLRKILCGETSAVVDIYLLADKIKTFFKKYQVQVDCMDSKYVIACALYDDLLSTRHITFSFEEYVIKITGGGKSEFGKYLDARIPMDTLLGSVFLTDKFEPLIDVKTNTLIEECIKTNKKHELLKCILHRAHSVLFGGVNCKSKITPFDFSTFIPLKRKENFGGLQSGKRTADHLRNELKYANSEIIKDHISETYMCRLKKMRREIIDKLFYIDISLLRMRYSLKLRALGGPLATYVAENIDKAHYILAKELVRDTNYVTITRIITDLEEDLQTVHSSYDFYFSNDKIYTNGAQQLQFVNCEQKRSLTNLVDEANKQNLKTRLIKHKKLKKKLGEDACISESLKSHYSHGMEVDVAHSLLRHQLSELNTRAARKAVSQAQVNQFLKKRQLVINQLYELDKKYLPPTDTNMAIGIRKMYNFYIEQDTTFLPKRLFIDKL